MKRLTCSDCQGEITYKTLRELKVAGWNLEKELCSSCLEQLEDWEGGQDRLYQDAKARNPRVFQD